MEQSTRGPLDVRPDEPVAIRFSKWDGSPHWAYDGSYLGSDEHGAWLWVPEGAPLVRPGRSMTSPHDGVLCIPPRHGHVLTTNAAPHEIRHYVDITTVPVWHRDGAGLATVSMVDLDLDVVERRDGHTYVDDEDEFADHQAAMGYPPELVTAAQGECDRVLTLVETAAEPYATVAEQWLGRGAVSPR